MLSISLSVATGAQWKIYPSFLSRYYFFLVSFFYFVRHVSTVFSDMLNDFATTFSCIVGPMMVISLYVFSWCYFYYANLNMYNFIPTHHIFVNTGNLFGYSWRVCVVLPIMIWMCVLFCINVVLWRKDYFPIIGSVAVTIWVNSNHQIIKISTTVMCKFL